MQPTPSPSVPWQCNLAQRFGKVQWLQPTQRALHFSGFSLDLMQRVVGKITADPDSAYEEVVYRFVVPKLAARAKIRHPHFTRFAFGATCFEHKDTLLATVPTEMRAIVDRMLPPLRIFAIYHDYTTAPLSTLAPLLAPPQKLQVFLQVIVALDAVAAFRGMHNAPFFDNILLVRRPQHAVYRLRDKRFRVWTHFYIELYMWEFSYFPRLGENRRLNPNHELYFNRHNAYVKGKDLALFSAQFAHVVGPHIFRRIFASMPKFVALIERHPYDPTDPRPPFRNDSDVDYSVADPTAIVEILLKILGTPMV